MESNYLKVLNQIKQRFLAENLLSMIKRTGVGFDKKNNLIYLNYFGAELTINTTDAEISVNKKTDYLDEITVSDSLMILSYFLDSKDDAVFSEEFVPYRNVKRAAPFEGAFIKTVINPLSAFFNGKSKEDFELTGKKLNARKATHGDSSFILKAFDNIHLTYILWVGDEEFPSKVNILYSKNINDFIHEECVPTIAGKGAELIMKIAGNDEFHAW